MFINIHFDSENGLEFFRNVYTGPRREIGIRWNNLVLQFRSKRSALNAVAEYRKHLTASGYESRMSSLKNGAFAGISNTSFRHNAKKLEELERAINFYWQRD